MIIVCGDSWACGEWSADGNNTHLGLSQYLEDDGHEVVNVGVAGSSNLEIAMVLDNTLHVLSATNKTNLSTITIILFQTEWYRDIGSRPHPTGLPGLQNSISDDLINKTISFWQYQLVRIAKKYKVKIQLVGGASDTMWLDKFEQEYPGVSVLCQSMTNLCVNNDSRIDDPVFGVRYPDELVTVAKSLCNTTDDLEYLIKNIDQGIRRFNVFDNHPKYFWPDGIHANRAAHYKLYKYIKERLSL